MKSTKTLHLALSNKQIKIPPKNRFRDPFLSRIMPFLGAHREGGHQKFSLCSETLHMNSEGLGEVFEGDFAENLFWLP